MDGIILVAIGGAFGEGVAKSLVHNKLDLDIALNWLFKGSVGRLTLKSEFNSVEIYITGVFAGRDLEIDMKA